MPFLIAMTMMMNSWAALYTTMSLKNGWNIAYYIAPESGKGEWTTAEIGGLKWGVTGGHSIPEIGGELLFFASGGTRELNVKTLVSDWTVEKYLFEGESSDWFSVVRSGDKIVVTVDKYENGEVRSGGFIVKAGGGIFHPILDYPMPIYTIRQIGY